MEDGRERFLIGEVFVVVQTQSMEALLSQLAETAAQERALLEECGDLLSVAASLEVTSTHRFSALVGARSIQSERV